MWVSSRWHEFLHLPSKVIARTIVLGGDDNGSGGGQRPQAQEGNLYGHESALITTASTVPDNLSWSNNPDAENDSRKRRVGPGQGLAKSKRIHLTDVLPARPESSHGERKNGDREPLFGHLSVYTTIEEADERRKIAAYLATKLPTIYPINRKDSKLILAEDAGKRSSDSEDTGPDPSFLTNSRLGMIHDHTEKWRFVGCELCFASTGQREPGHSLEDCERWSTSGAARRVLRWLERLEIPRYYGRQRGDCAICGHGWLPCDEVRMQFQLEKAAKHQPEDFPQLIAQYDSHQGRDGYCENRSVVRRMIAALSTYDNQILGKVLMWLVLAHYSVDFGDEKVAKGWFEQRVWSIDEYWVSRQLHVLDLLVLAFNWRQKQRESPETVTTAIPKLAWDNQAEVANWREALDWLRGKCSFCAGRGLGDNEIHHVLRKCHRGGAEQVRGNMGDLFYGGDYQPADGCHLCHLPRDFCSRWEAQGRERWTERQYVACSYSKNLLYDGIIGFSTCGVAAYREELLRRSISVS